MPTTAAPAQIPPDQATRVGKVTLDHTLRKSAMDALLGVQEQDLITVDEDPEVIKGSAKGSGCWHHTPAWLELSTAADRRLTRVAGLMGINVRRVDRDDMKLIRAPSS